MTEKRMVQAIALCWEDRQTDAEIAQKLGVGRRTLSRWKQTPEFKARYAAHLEAYRAELSRESIAQWQAEHAARYPPESETAQKFTKCHISRRLEKHAVRVYAHQRRRFQ